MAVNRVVWSVELIYFLLYNNKINACALIGQSAVLYCAGKPTENRASSELLYKSNAIDHKFLWVIYYLLTESEVITGKSQTEALMY